MHQITMAVLVLLWLIADIHIHRLHELLQFCEHENIQQVIHILDHMTRFHKTVVWIVLW